MKPLKFSQHMNSPLARLIDWPAIQGVTVRRAPQKRNMSVLIFPLTQGENGGYCYKHEFTHFLI